MPTYTFTRTLEQLRDMILRKLRARSDFSTPSANTIQIVNEGINLRLKSMHAQQVMWYQIAASQSDVALVAGTATANAPTDCLFPVSVALRIGNEDVPVAIVGHNEFQAIPDKVSEGEPTHVHFSGGVLRFAPVPIENYTAKITYEAIAEDVAQGDPLDIRVEMMRAFSVIVAADLIDDFGLPEERAKRLLAEAQEAKRDILRLNALRVDIGTTIAEYF